MNNRRILQKYTGQTIQEIIAMKDTHEIDSLVRAIYLALSDKAAERLSHPERVVLAVRAMDDEVNNGGWVQFCSNPSRQYGYFLPGALDLIGCPQCALSARDAFGILEFPPQHYDAAALEEAFENLSEEGQARFDECDTRYYENEEPITASLFAYIEQNQHDSRIPYAA